MTGILMAGKMSVGMVSAASGPIIRMASANTMNVYGRDSRDANEPDHERKILRKPTL